MGDSDLIPNGTGCFFQSKEHSWVYGKVVSSTQVSKKNVYDCVSEKTDVSDAGISASKLSREDVHPVRPDLRDENVHDLLNLKELHEATLLACLKRRYLSDIVYTNIGSIVVALNPFNYEIPHYKDDMMASYLTEGERITRNLPHSWACAHATYFEMLSMKQDQTILVSGESGAGKTEAAKIVLKYLGALSGQRCKDDESRERGLKVRHRILQASPILEAWGNAKTVRNDNSSRFGKFMKIQFDQDGLILGAFSIKYLLEKSRIVTAALNERVYHVFYQLCRGKDGGKYGCGDPGEFAGCRAGGEASMTIPGVDDGKDYDEHVQAMSDVGISKEDSDACFRVIAGTLHLLNIYFDSEGEGSKVSEKTSGAKSGGSKKYLDKAAELLGVPADGLARELTTFQVQMGVGEKVTRKNSAIDAAVGRDSLAKTMYNTLFGWLVDSINKTSAAEVGVANWIGLLDIFGFENFDVNSFEQLCINLANEALQNHYNLFVFNRDLEECQREGIDTNSVPYHDNTPCLELIRSKRGILGLLDDASALAKSTDATFLSAMDETIQGGGKTPHPFFEKKAQWKNKFVVKHYACDVEYLVDGFLEKNKDTLKPGLRQLIQASSVPFLAQLLPTPEETKGRAPTVGGTFATQVTGLIQLIESTNPHWIRCVKPHPAKKPLMFCGVGVMSQLRSSGILETVKMRKAGYPIRLPRPYFLGRYKILLGGNMSGDPATQCKNIFTKVKLDVSNAQNGTTKVFLKNPGFNALEEARDAALAQYAVVIQQCCRIQQSCVRRWALRYIARVRLIQASIKVRLSRVQQNRVIKRNSLHWIQSELREYATILARTRSERMAARKAKEESDAKEQTVVIGDESGARTSLLEDEGSSYEAIMDLEAPARKAAAFASRGSLLGQCLSQRLPIEGAERTARLEVMQAFHAVLTVLWEKEKVRLAAERKLFAERMERLVEVEVVEREKIRSLESLEHAWMMETFGPVIAEIAAALRRQAKRFARRAAKIALLEELRDRLVFSHESAQLADATAASIMLADAECLARGLPPTSFPPTTPAAASFARSPGSPLGNLSATSAAHMLTPNPAGPGLGSPLSMGSHATTARPSGAPSPRPIHTGLVAREQWQPAIPNHHEMSPPRQPHVASSALSAAVLTHAPTASLCGLSTAMQRAYTDYRSETGFTQTSLVRPAYVGANTLVPPPSATLSTPPPPPTVAPPAFAFRRDARTTPLPHSPYNLESSFGRDQPGGSGEPWQALSPPSGTASRAHRYVCANVDLLPAPPPVRSPLDRFKL